MNQYEYEAMGLLADVIVKAYRDRQDVDLVSIIAADCGWNPLEVKEKMTVHFGSKEYVIVRNS